MSSFTHKVKNLVTTGRRRDEYKPVQMEEAAESRVSLSTRHAGGRYTDITGEPNTDMDAEATVGLLTHDSDAVMQDEEEKTGRGRRGKRGLFMCCGTGLRTPSKVLGVVVFLALIFAAYKLFAWVSYKPPAGIENLPEFGTSLGCDSATYFYNDTQTFTLNAPMHPERFDHGVDFRGGAVGTITLTSSSTDSPNIRYEITIRSNDKDLVQKSTIKMPALDSAGKMFNSMSTIATGYTPKDNAGGVCLRYDVKMFIPPSLKELHLTSHTLSHVKLDENARIKMERLFITLFTTHPQNIIQSSTSVKSDRINLQLTKGWLVGDVSITDQTKLITQRGDGVLNVQVYPEPARDKENPEVASLETTTGAGRTTVVFHSNKGVKRPIAASHISSRNGPMEFTYKGSGFSGLVGLQAAEVKETGMQKLSEGDVHEGEQWNYYVGSKEGKDRMNVNSRAWVGINF